MSRNKKTSALTLVPMLTRGLSHMSSDIVPTNGDPRQLSFNFATNETPFDRIRHFDEFGNEYWLARELMQVLDYSRWQTFKVVIRRAMTACRNSGQKPDNHFGVLVSVTQSGKGRSQNALNYKLSRYACYLITLNGDPSKKVIAEGQTYFTIQTRKSEVAAEREAERKALKRKQDVTAYQLSGRSEDWAEVRIDSKESQKALNAALLTTHEENRPDFGAINGTINRELFEMTAVEIATYLGLLPSQAKHYRDHLGRYALEALKEVNYTSSQKMKQIKRVLTTEEQQEIVRFVVSRIAPLMRDLASYVNQDFVSGAPLDEQGRALIIRNIRLLNAGE